MNAALALRVLVLPVLASALLGLLGPVVARRCGHSALVRVLPVTCLLVATSTVVGGATLAVSALAGVDDVAELGRWSTRALPTAWRTLPAGVGVIAGLLVAGLLAAVVRRASALLAQLFAAGRVCRSADRAGGGVVVVSDARPHAFAVAGLPGRVVVSTGMLAVLDEPGQRALVAHERSHLHRRHHLSLIAVQLAAAADPLLRPLVAVTAHAVEREADEDAARVVGDRRAVGVAIARAGLATAAADRANHQPVRPTALPAATAGDVPRRVAALLAPPVPPRRLGAAVLLAFALLTVWPSALSGLATDHHIDHARAAYRPSDAERPDGTARRQPAGVTPAHPRGPLPAGQAGSGLTGR